MTPTPLRTHVASLAAGLRCGVVPPVQLIPTTFADPPGVFNAAIVGDTPSTLLAAAGGLGRTRAHAIGAAVGEALERYAASNAPLELRRRPSDAFLALREVALFSDAQRASRGFPFPDPHPSEIRYALAHDALDNRPLWVPHELVSLGPREGDAVVPSTSTGIAAAPTAMGALLRALEEVLERDAFAVHWLNGLGGRELSLEPSYVTPITALGGAVRAFDFTQAWNPHPVVVVCGQIPLRGRPRIGLGAACRATFSDAIEKAWLEWVQGVIFAGYWVNEHPDKTFASPSDVHDFEDHGGYYSVHPDRWDHVPLLRHARAITRPPEEPTGHPDAAERVELLVRRLGAAGVRVLYRDLTTVDVAQAGLHVVRAICPELTPLHGDERLPFLGGRASDWRWRFPDAPVGDGRFPSPHPHPLG